MMDKCESDKDLSICDGCGHLGLYCECSLDPKFNQMKDTIISDLVYFKTLDSHIAMTKEELNIVCRYSKVPIRAMTTNKVLNILYFGLKKEETI